MARHYFNTVENSVTGKPVNGATIEVVSALDVYLTIYSDDGTTAIDQSASPLTSDSTGFFEFWTDETSGTIRISYDGAVKRTITDVEFPDGAVTGDVSALAARLDAVELVTQDPLIVDIAALSDPNADRIMFWDDSVGDIGWLTAGTNLTITGTPVFNATYSGSTGTRTFSMGSIGESGAISVNVTVVRESMVVAFPVTVILPVPKANVRTTD